MERVTSHFVQLVKNFISLFLLQAVNYLTPFFMIPFILERIGVANFGISNYVLTIFITAKIIIDYGYNLSGVKEIVQHKGDRLEIENIVSRIFFTKVYLLLLLFLLLVAAILISPVIRSYSSVLVLSFVLVAGQALLPTWFFQAMEKTQLLLLMSVPARLVYIALIFFIVKAPPDYIYVNFCLGAADVLLSIGALYYIITKNKTRLRMISISEFTKELRSNFSIAKVNFFTSISMTAPLITLGLFSSTTSLGYYSIADRILQVIRTSAVILYSSTFPRVIELYNRSYTLLGHFVKKFHYAILIVYLPVLCILFFAPEMILSLMRADINAPTVNTLKILSFIPLLAALDIIPSHLLIIAGRNKLYANIFLFICSVAIAVSVINVYLFDYLGAAFSALAIELLTYLLLVTVNRRSLTLMFKSPFGNISSDVTG